MESKRPQILRDIILIGTLLLIVSGVFVIYYALKKEGELALVLYSNEVLFEVNMENGQTTYLTKAYPALEMPVIEGSKLLLNNEEVTYILEGEGVLYYSDELGDKNYYFIKGNLGYVKIYYNKQTKKMKVVEETSPYNTCSKQGESNDVPLICLPNFVSIKFSKLEVDDII